MKYFVIHWPQGQPSGAAIFEGEDEFEARKVGQTAREKWPDDRVTVVSELAVRERRRDA